MLSQQIYIFDRVNDVSQIPPVTNKRELAIVLLGLSISIAYTFKMALFRRCGWRRVTWEIPIITLICSFVILMILALGIDAIPLSNFVPNMILFGDRYLFIITWAGLTTGVADLSLLRYLQIPTQDKDTTKIPFRVIIYTLTKVLLFCSVGSIIALTCLLVFLFNRFH